MGNGIIAYIYLSSVLNAVASNKYKCEGYVCNDEYAMKPKDRKRPRERAGHRNWIKINYLYTFTQLIDGCLS